MTTNANAPRGLVGARANFSHNGATEMYDHTNQSATPTRASAPRHLRLVTDTMPAGAQTPIDLDALGEELEGAISRAGELREALSRHLAVHASAQTVQAKALAKILQRAHDRLSDAYWMVRERPLLHITERKPRGKRGTVPRQSA